MDNNRQIQSQPPAAINVADIYYVLFRHKWKIILFGLAGIAAAAALYHFKPPPFQSQAELQIQYVKEAATLSLGSEQKIIMTDTRGNDVINSEIKILTSLDVAKAAVTNYGAANILAKVGGGNDPIAAARVLENSLMAEPSDNGSSIIVVTFKSPDPKIVQPVLQEIITNYFKKHNEIHSAVEQFDSALKQEQSDLSAKLIETDNQIADLKNRANIISLDDAKKSLADQISQVKSSILDAKVGLAASEAAMKQVSGALPEELSMTNAQPAIPSDQIDAYNDICTRIGLLRKKEQEYLLQQGFTKGNPLVVEVDDQLAEAQKAKVDFEKKYPQIVGLGAASTASGGQTESPAASLRAQLQQSAVLQRKLQIWDEQLDQLQMETTNLNSLEPVLAQLEQVRANQQTYLQILSQGLEKSHIDQSLNSDKTPNIRWVQSPSSPFQDWKKTYKKMAAVAFGGIFGGIALAFLIELFLDRSVRRPSEIVTKLKLPLFLSIPDVGRNGHARLVGTSDRRQLKLHKTEEGASVDGDGSPQEKSGALQVVSLEQDFALQRFYEALRDRLIVYFEVRNLTHKPKLVAVTSANRGAGVSSIAAGLAASLSETGDGNVLLVDMNQEQGAAQQFYKGKAGCGLDMALKAETRENALVQANLYVVNGNAKSTELPGILPKRFSALVPKLKASNYDYIIFDMPSVSQTSLTSRLSRFMDMTLLVVEAEKSDREVVQQANKWLAESGATVGAVLNKTRKYIPSSLLSDFNSES